MKYLVIAFVMFAASQSSALDCKDIRAVVKMVGKEKAIQLARNAGATEEAIREAAQCLKGK